MWFFTLALLPLSLLATPLSTLIESAKNSHTSLEVLEHKISTVDNEYEISRNFADPELSLSMSDIQFDDPTNRSIEPMQQSAINFKQKLPYFGKRDALSAKIETKREKLNLTLDELKVKLVLLVKKTAYSLWQIEEELHITNEYIKLTKQNIDLYSNYANSDSSSHMSIMSAEMTLSELKIKKSRLESSLVGFYERLNYLSNMQVTSVELNMKVTPPKKITFYTDTKKTNLSYRVKEATLKETKKELKVKELASYVDPVLQVGYYHRQDYEDYASVGIAFSLPIYGSQDSKSEIARKLSLASKGEVTDYAKKLEYEIKQTHAKLESSYKVYDIIQNQSMPQIEHMFTLISSSIKNGKELYLYIDLLEKKLALDEKNIGVISSYHKRRAELDALVGEMR